MTLCTGKQLTLFLGFNRYIACLLLTSAFSINASANDPIIHRDISAEAVKQFNECFPDKSLSSLHENDFIDYSAYEDSLRHNPLRFRYWHFFRPEGDLGLSQGGSRISLDKRFNKLTKKLKKDIAKHNTKAAYKRLGRIAHYLQDVTSPAHVAPIYHWSGQKDAFDRYPFDQKAAAKYFKSHQTEICARIATEKNSPLFSILHDTAKLTIHASTQAPLSITNGTDAPATWGLFWKEDSTCKTPVKPKFKDYGPFANSFGDTEIFDRCDLNKPDSPYFKYCGGLVCLIEPKTYQHFAADRHRDALMASMKALHFLQFQISTK